MKLKFLLCLVLYLISLCKTCEIESCLPGHNLNKKRCQCVRRLQKYCNKSCKNGRYLNHKCACIRRKQCGIAFCNQGFDLNKRACQCRREETSPVEDNCKTHKC